IHMFPCQFRSNPSSISICIDFVHPFTSDSDFVPSIHYALVEGRQICEDPYSCHAIAIRVSLLHKNCG
ncbi:unnamed protein product, partial [Citrullus colocynthis]